MFLLRHRLQPPWPLLDNSRNSILLNPALALEAAGFFSFLGRADILVVACGQVERGIKAAPPLSGSRWKQGRVTYVSHY